MPVRLAIDGGTPVRGTMLPYARHVIDDDDVAAVVDVLRGDWLTTGPGVAAYEEAFAEAVGAKHAVAVSSGTAALHAATAASGLTWLDEVIVPPLSFVATANCIYYQGAKPVFADVDSGTCNLDPAAIEAQLTGRSRAILVVHFAGQPADMDAIRAVAQKHGLSIYEDAAHALGAKYKGQPVGALSPLTAFSTHPVKHIATGEGGMVTTDDDMLARKLLAFRNHGILRDSHAREREGDWHYDAATLGYNYRMPDVLCALGMSQLEKMPRWLARRQTIAARYTQAFENLPEIEPLVQAVGCESAWHLYIIRLRLDALRRDRGEMFTALRAEGIGVNVHYLPIYHHSHYQTFGYAKGLCPVAEAQYERMLTLPLWPGMGDDDVEDVITAVHKVVEASRA